MIDHAPKQTQISDEDKKEIMGAACAMRALAMELAEGGMCSQKILEAMFHCMAAWMAMSCPDDKLCETAKGYEQRLASHVSAYVRHLAGSRGPRS